MDQRGEVVQGCVGNCSCWLCWEPLQVSVDFTLVVVHLNNNDNHILHSQCNTVSVFARLQQMQFQQFKW